MPDENEEKKDLAVAGAREAASKNVKPQPKPKERLRTALRAGGFRNDPHGMT
jgi:hypothetical protein